MRILLSPTRELFIHEFYLVAPFLIGFEYWVLSTNYKKHKIVKQIYNEFMAQGLGKPSYEYVMRALQLKKLEEKRIKLASKKKTKKENIFLLESDLLTLQILEITRLLDI